MCTTPNCNLKNNNNGFYNHDNIVKVRETIEGKLNKVFLDHNIGLGMIKLLANTNNAINMVKTNQMISMENVINKAKKEAMIASTAACKKDKNADNVKPTITMREEATREASRTLPTKKSWVPKTASSKSSNSWWVVTS